MRNSNYLFTKGTIVFVKFPSTSENAFLNGRPLIVVSNPTHILKTLIVCTTGTRDKPGIQASFYNHVDKCYVGDAEVSNIYPYSLKTIYTDQIIASIGQLDPFIMDELDKAIDFHLGRSREVPKYLEECSEELTGVSYNGLDGKFIKPEKISSEYIPAVNYKRQYRKTEEKGAIQKHSSKNEERKSNTAEVVNGFNVGMWINSKYNKDIDLSIICRDGTSLSQNLDNESIIIICSRLVPISIVAEKYNVTTRIATVMRNTLTEMLINIGSNLLKSQGNRVRGNLSEIYILSILLAREFSNTTPNNNILVSYSDRFDRFIQKYKINFSDKRLWKSMNMKCR